MTDARDNDLLREANRFIDQQSRDRRAHRIVDAVLAVGGVIALIAFCYFVLHVGK